MELNYRNTVVYRTFKLTSIENKIEYDPTIKM